MRLLQTALLLLVLCIGALAGDATRTAPPNIVFIVSDDHRFDALGASGNSQIHTPHLNRLAEDGILFTQASVACPQCSPSRATMLTGLYPHQHGYYSNKAWSKAAAAGFVQPTAVERLRQAGYQTALIGKWHLEPAPWKCGFEEIRTWMPQGSDAYVNAKLASGRKQKTKERRGHVTEIFSDDAIAFLAEQPRRTAAKPFFLWLSYTAPHTPQKPVPDRAQAPYRELPREARPAGFPPGEKTQAPWAQYYAAITHLDEQIGRVLKSLDEHGLRENTVVIFMGDNGWMMGSHGRHGKMLPDDESVRVPFIVRAPGGIQGWCGKSSALASSVDLAPTWLALAQVEIPREWPGLSLLSLLRDEKPVTPFRPAVFSQFDDEKNWPGFAFRMIRTHDWKYVLRPPRAAKEMKKLIKDYEKEQDEKGRKPPVMLPEQLFDLRTDAHELKDVHGVASAQEAGAQLRAQLIREMEELGDPALEWFSESRRAAPVIDGAMD